MASVFSSNFSVSNIGLDSATIQSYSGSVPGTFKLVISSSAAAFGTADGFTNIKILTASLDPESDAYISNILNTDPVKFQSEEHLLYAHFPVENELAKVTTDKDSVGIVSGSANTSISSGDTSMAFRNIFGSFNTRYQTCKTTPFISQPYGSKEYDLFHFECLSDGEVANSKYKISITSVRRSTDATNPYGAFTVEIRDFNDTDTSPSVLESYPNCTLNPDDDDYIAKKIGDINTSFNFDADSLDERRLVIEGKYPNVSARVRVVMNVDVDVKRAVPKDALPFGFRGLPVIKTNDSLTDKIDESLKGGHSNHPRLAIGSITGSMHPYPPLTASVLPPVPFRFKVTRGATSTSPGFAGHPGDREITDSRLYWGVKFERLPLTASMTNAILNPNASSKRNELLSNYSKFLGISKLDALVTGSGADVFCNNKFTLARVALYNTYATSLSNTVNTKITGSAKEHMLDTAYIRNGDVNVTNYTVSDGTLTNRMTLASLMAITSSVYFNKFADYNKFTNLMYGGFDGVNILDKDMKRMNDRATSLDSYGKAAGGAIARYGMPSTFTPGVGTGNNAIASYRAAVEIMTDPMSSRINVLAIPGIKDPLVSDFALDKVRDYSQAIYLLDIPHYTDDYYRIYSDTSRIASVGKTSEKFEGRGIDNNYGATYFPDVVIKDETNNRPASVPSSVAAMAALAHNDAVAYPWFAPAGFNRAALDFVTNTSLRLTQGDRDTLYETSINPIANFPNAGFVIFGQKTLQQAKSALDRVNVRRMLLEVKRLVVNVANSILFEPNTPETRARFVSQVTPLLSTIQNQQGIDQFRVVMDSNNNTPVDIEANRINGRIILVPTRAVEFIAIDFIITNSGVSFG